MNRIFPIPLNRPLAYGGQNLLEQPLNWSKGSIIRGRVAQALAPGVYVVAVGGRPVIAQAPFSLTVGQEIALEVQGSKDGQVMARLVSDQQGTGVVSEQILSKLGIEHTSLSRTILQAVTGFQMELTPENFDLVAQGLAMQNRKDLPAARLVAFALKAGLPVHQEVLSLLAAAFSPDRLDLFPALSQWVKSAGQVWGPEGEEPVSLRQLRTVLGAMALRPDDPVPVLTTKLAAVFNSQLPGLAVPPNPASQGEAGKAIIPGESGRQPPGQVPGEAGTPGTGSSAGLPRAIAGSPGEQPASLAVLITQLTRELEQITGGGKAALGEHLTEGNFLEKQAAGRYLWQVMDKSGLHQSDYVFFSIPFQLGAEDPRTAYLRIYKDGKTRRIDPENCRIALVLDTAGLGPLTVELMVIQREIHSKITVQEERIIPVGRLLWPELQDALAIHGFLLGQPEWRTGPPPDLKPAAVPVAAARLRGRLDVRV
ncbi:MAG: hypothetical protein PHC60_01485 [Heliobacteriaceae bacterium]|nr:hypothetical protein [Heliobacteriaceae bacterium]